MSITDAVKALERGEVVAAAGSKFEYLGGRIWIDGDRVLTIEQFLETYGKDTFKVVS